MSTKPAVRCSPCKCKCSEWTGSKERTIGGQKERFLPASEEFRPMNLVNEQIFSSPNFEQILTESNAYSDLGEPFAFRKYSSLSTMNSTSVD